MPQWATDNSEMFKISFREEAREILGDLESALLKANENRDDSELIGHIFRGLHTLKGSGAMFGFENLAAFTHDLETAFDLVRSGHLEMSTELIELTLAALDQISLMVEEGEEGAAPADDAACNSILARVRHLTPSESQIIPAQQAEPAADVPSGPPVPIRSWRIRFAPGPDLMRFGAKPSLLIEELRQLGKLSVKATTDAVPPLAEVDPERCYVSWDIDLATSEGPEAIRDVFIFVENTCELSVELAADSAMERKQAEVSCEADVTARLLEEPRSSGGRRSYDKPDNATSLRVTAAKLDQFVDLVGEMVTVQAKLSEIAGRRDDGEITAVSEEIGRLTSALRESSMSIRMMPIRATFEKFRRLVHDLARNLDKKVELIIEGADTELDKTVIEQLSDPLMHLIRNSMDHGIGSPEDRATVGKPAVATIRLSACHSGASVLVSVTDDGRGIDCAAVRQRAIEKGLIPSDAQLSESQIFALLFEPGFSTAKQVTDVSGRGVGMDVVRQRVESLHGTVEITSKPGEGTCVMLRLPLTMAIIDGLLVAVANASFVLPLASTLECIELTRENVAFANGKHLVEVRGQLVPYIRLRERFHLQSDAPEIEQVMLVDTSEGRFGLVVDRVLGNCQTVIKSLGRFYRQVQIVSGATILGNGSVALILDPERLVQEALSEEVNGKAVRGVQPRGERRGNSVDGMAPAARGSAGPSTSARCG